MFQLAAALTTPFDVVKTFQQIELTEKEIIAGWLYYLLFGVIKIFRKIFKWNVLSY